MEGILGMKQKLYALAYIFFELPPRLQWIIVAAWLTAITLVHNSIQTSDMYLLMVAVQKLFFLPVILAGFVGGFWGGLGIAALAVSLYPHYRLPYLHIDYMLSIPVVTDMVLLFVVGATTGWLSDRIKDELERHRRTARERDQALQELKLSYERARRAEHLAALGQMAAGIAHEVRNPLTSMQGAVDVLQRSITTHPQRAETLLKRLESEIGRLDEITKHVLLYARPPQTAREPMNPHPWLSEIVDGLRDQAQDRGLTLELASTPNGAHMILGDRDQLRQVILNLVLNAVHFADMHSTITIESRFLDGQWELSVSNTGPEIRAEDREHIFEPFYTTRADGTGLGLAIGARIAEAHHGTLQCSSENRITRFTLTIPEA